MENVEYRLDFEFQPLSGEETLWVDLTEWYTVML